MKRFVFLVAALALGALLVRADPAFAERRIALVIGNSAYRNAPILVAPRRDALAMAAKLREVGYDGVTVETDVGVAQLKNAIAKFRDEARHSDIAVIYFAGYGLNIQGVNYVVPVDAKLASGGDAGAEAITLEALAGAADPAPRLRLVIVDASRSDPFMSGSKQQNAAAAPEVYQGLAEPAPKPGSLIAYAAMAGSESEDGDGENSTYAAAVLHNLFTPGLDIRLAFGRVLVEVLKNTNKRQNPLVYGSLAGGNIALVPAPADRPALDLQGEKTDYSVVEQIGSARAWEAFLVQHPTGFYAADARVQLRVAEAEPAKPRPSPASDQMAWEKIKNSGDLQAMRDFIQEFPASTLADAARKNAERLAALEQPPAAAAPVTPPAMPPLATSPEQIASAQRELLRLGCFSGAADGSMNSATVAAIRAYQDARGQTPSGEPQVTDALIGDMQKQTPGLCPPACPPGKISDGKQCVDAAKSVPVARSKDEDIARPTKPATARQEERPAPVAHAAPPAPPRAPAQAAGSHGPHVGVGF
jgi:peptidoglycan hydrolase-like protein with peptidoglycan-binding domain